MLYFLLVVLIVAILIAVLIGVAVGIGALLHLLVPQIDLGIASLIALIATIFVTYVFFRLTNAAQDLNGADEDEEETEKQRQVVYVMPDIPPLRAPRPRRRR